MYVKFHTHTHYLNPALFSVREDWYAWHFHMDMDLQEIGWEGVDCIELIWDRNKWQAVLSSALNHWVWKRKGDFLTS